MACRQPTLVRQVANSSACMWQRKDKATKGNNQLCIPTTFTADESERQPYRPVRYHPSSITRSLSSRKNKNETTKKNPKKLRAPRCSHSPIRAKKSDRNFRVRPCAATNRSTRKGERESYLAITPRADALLPSRLLSTRYRVHLKTLLGRAERDLWRQGLTKTHGRETGRSYML